MNALASRLIGLALSQHVSMLQQRTCFKTVFSALEFSAWRTGLKHWTALPGARTARVSQLMALQLMSITFGPTPTARATSQVPFAMSESPFDAAFSCSQTEAEERRAWQAIQCFAHESLPEHVQHPSCAAVEA
jgi:hypothetical protein